MAKIIATNKKAFRNFVLADKMECGIALIGGEVKSIRAGKVNFKDSYARIDGEEVWLYNLHINPYAEASYMNEDPDRPRKLLLHKKQIKKITGTLAQKSVVFVPTKIYLTQRGLVKLEMALGRSRKLYDKRAVIKERDLDRDIKRAIRTRRKGSK